MHTDGVNHPKYSVNFDSMTKLDTPPYPNTSFNQLLEKKKAAVSESLSRAIIRSVEKNDNEEDKKEKEDPYSFAILLSDSNLINSKTGATETSNSKIAAKSKNLMREVADEKRLPTARALMDTRKMYTDNGVNMQPFNFEGTTAAENDRQLSNQTPVINNENESIMSSVVPCLREIPVVTQSLATLQGPISSQQWPAALGQQLLFFNRHHIQQAQIHLHQQELGSLHIQLAMHDGKMHLDMATVQQSVKGVLESAMPDLQSSLADQGIKLLTATINGGSSMQFASHDASKYVGPMLDKDSLSNEAKLDSQSDSPSLINQSVINIFV